MKKHYNTICCCLLLCVFAGTAVQASPTSELYCSTRIAAFYPDYNVSELSVSEVRFDQLTDIVYFSISPNEDGSLNLSFINKNDPNTMVDVVQAAKDNNVKVWICVGGADGRSDYFSDVVADPGRRDTFSDALVQFCIDNGFDGIDLDWEPIDDSPNYAIFIRELKTKMTPHSMELSVDVYAESNGLNPEAFDSIDWLHVMAYDMYEESPHSTYEKALAGLAFWEDAGFPRRKIILGLPFFGREVVEDGETQNSPYYSYGEIVTEHLSLPVDPDIDAVDPDTGEEYPDDTSVIGVINFNGIDTIKAKTQYVLENGYGGVMFWELTNDTADGTSLLTAISEQIQVSSPPDFNCDSIIDIADLSRLISDWLMNECGVDNTWCQRSDLDISTEVNISDFSIFSRYWRSVLQGDINNDTHVDLSDVVRLMEQWLWDGGHGEIPEDVYIDGRVNMKDFALVAKMWMTQ